MISVIIPVYNQAQKLIKTIDSLVHQSYTNIEIIIINDGSTDNVESIFTEHLNKIVDTGTNKINSLFINQVNRGAPAARNKGRSMAKGEYLFFCDADAILEYQALEKLLSALEINNSVSYAYSSFYWGHKLFKLREFDPQRLKKEPYIHTMSLIRTSDFPVNGWDETIKKFQDWDLWLTMLEQGKIGVFVDQVLFKITTGGTISSWLPSFTYKLLPFLSPVKKYNKALKIIQQKHGL